MDGGRSGGTQSTRRIACNEGQPNGASNGTNVKVGSNLPTNGGQQCDTETVIGSIFPNNTCTSTRECEWSFGKSSEGLDTNQDFTFKLDYHMDPIESLDEKETEVHSVSKKWQEDTILEAMLPPMTETPVVIRNPRGLWKYEMQITTRLDLDQNVQRVIKTRFIPLVATNQEALSMANKRTVNIDYPGSCAHSVVSELDMKVLMWNCRDLARPSFTRVMKSLIKKHKPSIVALLETRTIAEVASRFVQKLGYKNSIIVDPQGLSGGLILLWNEDEVDVQATSQTRWSIHVVVTSKFNNHGFSQPSMPVQIKFVGKEFGVS